MDAVSSIRVQYRDPSTLEKSDLDRIWSFFQRFVERERVPFEKKLLSTSEVFLGEDAAGDLVLFGAVEVLTRAWEGESYGMLFTHWAALDPRHRGNNILQKIGLKYYLKYQLRHPTRMVYWILGASTFKSYLLLVHNFLEFWPRRDVAWPDRERALVAGVMGEAQDANWDEVAGLLRRRGASRYREGVVADEPGVTLDPDLRFYSELNPAQAEGDTLLCIAPLTAKTWLNMARVGARRLLRGRRRARSSSSEGGPRAARQKS